MALVAIQISLCRSRPFRVPIAMQKRRHNIYNVTCFEQKSLLPRAASPEFPEPFALPTDNRVCLDVHQRMSPIRPQAAESDPKYPVAGRQQGALPFSLKRG